MADPLDASEPIPAKPPDPVFPEQREGANSTPQLSPAIAPNPLPFARTQPLPEASSNGQWPRAEVTLPATGPDPATRPGQRGWLEAGELALLLLACAGVALLAGVIVALHDRDPYRVVLIGGPAFVTLIPVAFMIVFAMRRR
jgi:hypothetical protein